MNLSAPIKSAEQQFRQKLEEYFASVYKEYKLPSHGISHHRRVWEYAKDLMLIPGEAKKINDHRIPFSLIIACYLHDVGMTIDSGPRHGQHSVENCREFLRRHNLDEKDFPDLMQAILNHDNKNYDAAETSGEVQTILSVADDLDAFGFIGIYRYLEIYITRKTDPDLLGNLISVNATRRFNNLQKRYGFAEAFVEKHRKRFRILADFFSCNGYAGVAELISGMMKKGKAPEELFLYPPFEKDSEIRYFLEGFKTEMNNVR